MSANGGFWAQRRAAVKAEEAAELEAIEAAEIAAAQAEKTDAEILAELDLADPDTMQPGDDFTGFMAKAVPEHLRRRALRVLWRSNPVLANVDMLVDYGEDFTDAATVIENMSTTYQVGKGMLKHVEEMARQAEAAEAAEDAAQDEEEAPLAEPEVAEGEDAPEMVAETQTAAPPEFDTDEPEPEDAVLTPRRMTFQIEETA